MTAMLDPKAEELASIPVGIDVQHAPNPVKARLGGRSGCAYTWLFTTTVATLGGPLLVVEFGALVWHEERWVFSTITGRPFTSADFADWYSCPGARLEPGKQYADPHNWAGGQELRAAGSRWYFIGVNDRGERVKGEAIAVELAQLVE